MPIAQQPVVFLADTNSVNYGQFYSNPGGIWDGYPYYFEVNITLVLASMNAPNQFDTSNLEVGMWFAEQSGRAWLITGVTIIDSQQATLIVKDQDLYNLTSSALTDGGNVPPSGSNKAIIFSLSEDGIPLLNYLTIHYSGGINDPYFFINDLTSRFQYRNLLTANYNNSDSPNPTYSTYQVGQMVYLDSFGVFQVLDASNAVEVKKRFGVITSVNVPEDGDLGVRPWGKIVGDLDLSSFTIGDALYYDDTDPTGDGSYLTPTEPASSAIPMYIKISNTTGMYITDMVGGGGDQIYISQVADGTPTPEDVGGIDAGTLPENIGGGAYTLSEVIDQLLWPAICPTAPSGQPNVTLSDNVNPNLEIIGDTINVAFTTGATGGLFSDGSTYAGDLTAATLIGAGSTNESLAITAPYGIADYTLNNYTVVSGTQSWTLTGTFAAGPIPVDNLGGDCPDVQYTGGTDTASVSFEGVYPVYAGNSTTYVGSASGTWTSASVNTTYWTQLSLFSFSNPYFQWDQSYDEDGVAPDVVRHRFVIPADLTVTDVQQFSTASNSYGSIGTSGFTQTNVTLDLFGNSVNYVVWEKNVSPGGSAQYRVYFS